MTFNLELKIEKVRVACPTYRFGKMFRRKGKKVRQLRKAIPWKLKAKYGYELGETMVCHSKEAEDQLLQIMVDECRKGAN